MTKGQHGNKELKKPKKIREVVSTVAPLLAPARTGVPATDRPKKK